MAKTSINQLRNGEKEDPLQGVLTDFGVPEPKPKVKKKKRRPTSKKPTHTIRQPKRSTSADIHYPIPLNPIPHKEEFRKIRGSRFPYTCEGGCHGRFPAGSDLFWRRTEDADGIYHTVTICPTCWRKRNTGR